MRETEKETERETEKERESINCLRYYSITSRIEILNLAMYVNGISSLNGQSHKIYVTKTFVTFSTLNYLLFHSYVFTLSRVSSNRVTINLERFCFSLFFCNGAMYLYCALLIISHCSNDLFLILTTALFELLIIYITYTYACISISD